MDLLESLSVGPDVLLAVESPQDGEREASPEIQAYADMLADGLGLPIDGIKDANKVCDAVIMIVTAKGASKNSPSDNDPERSLTVSY